MRTISVMFMLLISGLIVLPNAAADHPVYPECETIGNADIMLVMDRSGSMYGQPLADSKSGANFLLGQLIGSDHSGLVSYSSSASLDKGLDNVHTGATNTASTEYAVNAMSAGGGTNIAIGIQTGHQEFTNNGRSNVGWFMVLLSDGVSGNTAATHAAATAAKNDGIIIFSIGFGPNVNQAELEGAATSPSHYYNPTTASDLQDVFDDIRNSFKGKAKGMADAYDLFVEVNEPNYPGGAAVRVDKLNFVDAPNDEHLDVQAFNYAVNNVDIFGKVLHAEATVDVGTHRVDSAASAQIVDFGINYNGAALLRVDVLRSEVDAYAMNGAAGYTTDGETLGVQIRNNQLAVSGSPLNTQSTLGYVLFDEVVGSSTSGSSQVYRNALHVFLDLPLGETVEIIVSHAHASALCGEGSIDDSDPPTDDPAVPKCLIGQEVEPSQDHANDVEVDICPPVCSSTVSPPGGIKDIVLLSPSAGLPGGVAVPGLPGGPTPPAECCPTDGVQLPRGLADSLPVPRIAAGPIVPGGPGVPGGDPCDPDPCPVVQNLIDFDCTVPCEKPANCPVDPCVLLQYLGLSCDPDPCELNIQLLCPVDPCDSFSPDPCDVTSCFSAVPPTTTDIKNCVPDTTDCRKLAAMAVTQISTSDVKACVQSLQG